MHESDVGHHTHAVAIWARGRACHLVGPSVRLRRGIGHAELRGVDSHGLQGPPPCQGHVFKDHFVAKCSRVSSGGPRGATRGPRTSTYKDFLLAKAPPLFAEGLGARTTSSTRASVCRVLVLAELRRGPRTSTPTYKNLVVWASSPRRASARPAVARRSGSCCSSCRSPSSAESELFP